MKTFKQFLAEQALSTEYGYLHFDWVVNSSDDTKMKTLELKDIQPEVSGKGSETAMMKIFLKTQEAGEADVILVTAPKDKHSFYRTFGFESTTNPNQLKLSKKGQNPYTSSST